jgi:hypothetical protein
MRPEIHATGKLCRFRQSAAKALPDKGTHAHGRTQDWAGHTVSYDDVRISTENTKTVFCAIYSTYVTRTKSIPSHPLRRTHATARMSRNS